MGAGGGRQGWIGLAVDGWPGHRPIGVADPRDLGSPHRAAGLGITIGAAGRRGRGPGTEVPRPVPGDAFRLLGVHNVPLAATAAKAGFEEIGRRRPARWRDGRRLDVVFMDRLATEFAGRAAG